MIKQTLFFGNPAYLSLKNKQLVIERPGDDNDLKPLTRTVPIEDIGVVLLDNRQITVTSAVLAALLDNNVAVITCDSASMPTGLMLPLCGNTLQNERFRNQLSASVPLCKQLWQQTIQKKIENQAEVLFYSTGINHEYMASWSRSVRSGDAENHEARAAAYYWKNLFPQIDNFIRDRYEEAPNNILNYGYAILRAVIARALTASGLLPTLGIHHHNRYNAYCLADDIMEPYRPFVDKMVVDMVADYGKDIVLTKEIKAILLKIPVLDVNIDGHVSPLMIAATTTSASLVKCFSGELRKISYPELIADTIRKI